MEDRQVVDATEAESRALAERSRQAGWEGRSFLRELFLGSLRVDWIAPWPEHPASEAFLAYRDRLERFLVENVDSARIDGEGSIPPEVIDGLAELGAFGLEIPEEYGGMGFDQVEYCRLIELVASHDGNLTALLSAHQSIGVPRPVMLFGTEEQKARLLPRCAKGAISAFALTEPDVGSDPARLSTRVERTPEGDYLLHGEKLWITNGTIAELFVVMARHADTGLISAFVVEGDQPGVSVGPRCHFMGLRALENGVVRFDRVRVPPENLLGQEGDGLRIALTTLNTGRLSLPSACVGASRRALGYARRFAAQRVQWGRPVGRHEAVAHKLADIAATTFAMESWCQLANTLSLREGYDIRLEAAAAKEYGSVQGWRILDEVMQIRGGRGYENESSLAARGEEPWPVERMLRDARINRIFEGSSEIMHLFMAREMVDRHLQVAGVLLDRRATQGDKLRALPRILAFYAVWYTRQWIGLRNPFMFRRFGVLGRELRWAERQSRRLARAVFHGMLRHGSGLERKQAFLFRTVDIAVELAVLVAVVVRAAHLAARGLPGAERAVELARLHAANVRRTVDATFPALWSNDDDLKTSVGHSVVDGAHAWLELSDAPEPSSLADRSDLVVA